MLPFDTSQKFGGHQVYIATYTALLSCTRQDASAFIYLHVFSEESPSSILAPYYQNRSCDPFTDPSTACLLGNYAVYSIAASSAEDIAAGINFARAKNVRLVIKNTGHE